MTPGHAGSRDLELEVSANNSKQEQQRRELRDPKGDSLESAWIQRDQSTFQAGFPREILDRFGDACGEQWFAVDYFGRLLRSQRQERPFRMHHAVADFHFLLLGHESFADVRIMAVARGGAANRARTSRKGFCRVLFPKDLRQSKAPGPPRRLR